MRTIRKNNRSTLVYDTLINFSFFPVIHCLTKVSSHTEDCVRFNQRLISYNSTLRECTGLRGFQYRKGLLYLKLDKIFSFATVIIFLI